MNQIFNIHPQLCDKKYGTEPSLTQLLVLHYSRGGYTLKESEELAAKYIDFILKEVV